MFNKRIFFSSALLASLMIGGWNQVSIAAAADGKALFEANCAVCHSMQPPPKSAPPVLGIALHYRKAFGTDRKAAIKHMVAFMQKPEATHSKLEPAAITRFGLMPAMTLSVNDLRTVSAWLWDQNDPKFTLPGNCK